MKYLQKGQSIIEFALVAPLFLMLVFGMMYGGMMMADYLALKNLAGNVARIRSNVSTNEEATAKIQTAIKKTTLIYCETTDISNNVLPNETGWEKIQDTANDDPSTDDKKMKIAVAYNYKYDTDTKISTVEVQVVSCPKKLPSIIGALQPDKYLAKGSAVF